MPQAIPGEKTAPGARSGEGAAGAGRTALAARRGEGARGPVTCAGGRAGEHQGQQGARCLPGASLLPWSLCQPKPGTWASSTSGNQCRIYRVFSWWNLFISVRDASPRTDTRPAALRAVPTSPCPCSLPGARFAGGRDGACSGDGAGLCPTAPSREHRGAKPGTDAGAGEGCASHGGWPSRGPSRGQGTHLLQNLLFRLQAGKTSSSSFPGRVFLRAVLCGNLPLSLLGTRCPKRGSSCPRPRGPAVLWC